MTCPSCMEDFEIINMYTINCGSSVKHRMCHPCEKQWRMTMKGVLTCPMCRAPEISDRNESLQTVYYYQEEREEREEAYTRAVDQSNRVRRQREARRARRQYEDALQHQMLQVSEPTSQIKVWCQSGLREKFQCPTKTKTTRKCSYPSGCERNVCRICMMCPSHFEF